MSTPPAASVRPLSAPGPRRPRASWWLALGLLVLTAAVYAPVRHYGFINLDDPVYVTHNRHVRAGLSLDGIVWAFTAPHAATWHPLTSVSHMLDCTLFGMNPGAHHLTNVALHVLNTLLLFGLLVRTTGRPWRSACVAALFGLHPLHVESVAWISERKDVLSTAFWLLTVWAFVAYTERPSRWRYGRVLAAYGAALLSKPMAVTLPVVLLLLDIWPLRRLGNGDATLERGAVAPVLIEKLPLALMAAGASAITVVTQGQTGATVPALWAPFADRAANALVSYGTYIVRMLWPSGLAVFYPFEAPLPTGEILAAALLLGAVTALALWQRQRHPYLLVGWLWYVVTLIPVIGLLPVGDQAMADRYTYVPLIGIFIMAAWGIPALLEPWPQRQAVSAVAAAAAVVACIVLTARQLSLWQDSTTLFGHAVSVTRNNFVAHFCLGLTLVAQGRGHDAAARFAETLRIRPAYAPAHYEMGRLLAADGKWDEAVAAYGAASRLSPHDAEAHLALADALLAAGQHDRAIQEYTAAVHADPGNAEAQDHLGVALMMDRRLDDAIRAFREAVRLNPSFAAAHNHWGVALSREGRVSEAIEHYTMALRYDPGYEDAQFNLHLAEQERSARASGPH